MNINEKIKHRSKLLKEKNNKNKNKILGFLNNEKLNIL